MIDRWRVGGGVAYYLSVRGLDPGRASGWAVSKPFLNAPLGNVTASSFAAKVTMITPRGAFGRWPAEKHLSTFADLLKSSTPAVRRPPCAPWKPDEQQGEREEDGPAGHRGERAGGELHALLRRHPATVLHRFLETGAIET